MGVFPAPYILARGNEQHSHSILLITSERVKSSAGRGDFFFSFKFDELSESNISELARC